MGDDLSLVDVGENWFGIPVFRTPVIPAEPAADDPTGIDCVIDWCVVREPSGDVT